ncbi:Protein MSP1 [Grifola frondosa]|uniref:Protein MSP1 n=1 Tax=Grifola frondosa TaxID=5627 RepID=A0A1C7MFD3_GRIFR|nr:Protein MSP1 [Grifola frondosa]
MRDPSLCAPHSVIGQDPTPILPPCSTVVDSLAAVSSQRLSFADYASSLEEILFLGNTPSAETEPPIPPEAPAASAPPDPPSEDVEEKPKRRTRITAAIKDSDPVELPSGLKILWTPEDDPVDPSSSTTPDPALPPTEIFEEILHNLHITLHPQTQHRATYSSNGHLVEPTFALYCPIEGGDYIIDDTVRELARRTGADVVVLDAVQLAAGECGHFGKGNRLLLAKYSYLLEAQIFSRFLPFQLPDNPLHFSSTPSSSRRNARSVREEEEEDEEDSPSQYIMSSPMTLHVMAALPTRMSRSLLAAPQRSSPTSRLKAFFDELINIALPPPPTLDGSDTPSPPPPPLRRPRIVYIRDFPTLADSSSIWYSALLAAVRQRRQGPLSRPSSPVVNPMTIVFGITPSFIASPPTPSLMGSSNQGLIGLLRARHSSQSTGTAAGKSNKPEYGEDNAGDKARERRMLHRLRRWAGGDTTADDLPQLILANDAGEAASSSKSKSNVMVVGEDPMSNLPSLLGSALSGAIAGRNRGPYESESRSRFFRTSIVVPAMRSLAKERASRIARRREINELTMRMGIAAVGGELQSTPELSAPHEGESIEAQSTDLRMWEEWGRTVEIWTNVRRIADKAVGSVIAANRTTKPSLDSTPIPWSAVYNAWATDRYSQEAWKSLIHPPGKIFREHDEDDEGAERGRKMTSTRRDPDLDVHEQRLLGCIVDTGSLTTTFNQVHLPAHTIDSVRTIVSLPLLHPGAFQHGILKEHSMTGCLLFGPPGTGKTLVVRALAKEAGCRMLAVSPSDVMDMYVGEGEKLVRSVFSLARRLSPCVVFIDELDALLGARMSRDSGGAIAHRGVITEFMQAMDGLKSSKDDNVIVIGATNRPFDLDDAVLRRLPRRLLVDLPGEKEREEILKILLRDETLTSDVDLKSLAKKTESFSGSDLKHLCVSAALDAVKERVNVPWRTASSATPMISPPATAGSPTSEEVQTITPVPSEEDVQPSQVQEQIATSSEPTEVPHSRTLAWRNFEKALKEITPSASESSGSLAELRKWNDEFGEGRKERKKQVWGKGTFGFSLRTPESKEGQKEPAIPAGSSTNSDTTSVS